MAEQDARYILGTFYSLSGVASIARQEPIRVKMAIYEGTLDNAVTTSIVLNSLGLINPVVLAVQLMVTDGADTGNWEVYDNRDASSTAKSFRIDYYDGAAATPHQIRVAATGTDMRAQKFRLVITYCDRL